MISGLDESTCVARLGGIGCRAELEWLPPEAFIRRAEALAADASAQTTDRWVWLYRAPWALDEPPASAELGPSDLGVGDADTSDRRASDRLTRWYQHQRSALALRRTLGPRMLLVNAERVAGAALALELGLGSGSGLGPGPDLDSVGEGHAADGLNGAGSAENAQAPAWLSPDSIGQGLARLFDWVLPQYWDLFEDLEAAAWLPRGEPLFRQVLQPVSQEALARLLEQVEQGRAVPALRRRLSEQHAAVASLESAQREVKTALEREQHRLAELEQQSAQRISDLERGLETATAERAALVAERDDLQARLDEGETALAGLRQALESSNAALAEAQHAASEAEAARTALSAREQALNEEQARLSAELQRLQAVLDGQSSANQALRARLARSTETLDRARIQLCRQLARQGLKVDERP
jgi:predicted  nucleic acid-binding Zn-ribbon protein